MSASITLHTRLNALRVSQGLPARKHPLSIAKMEAEIASLEPVEAPARNTSEVAEYARAKGINPKVARALLRRHFEKPATGWVLTDAIRAKLDECALRVAA